MILCWLWRKWEHYLRYTLHVLPRHAPSIRDATCADTQDMTQMLQARLRLDYPGMYPYVTTYTCVVSLGLGLRVFHRDNFTEQRDGCLMHRVYPRQLIGSRVPELAADLVVLPEVWEHVLWPQLDEAKQVLHDEAERVAPRNEAGQRYQAPGGAPSLTLHLHWIDWNVAHPPDLNGGCDA